mmetsp:Transcript_119842/g.383739  ORF Transcript_119842/g.383739 Transcript_119842/m.383739 type:complete len:226 (+) Transcript_119842:636-1313(+)
MLRQRLLRQRLLQRWRRPPPLALRRWQRLQLPLPLWGSLPRLRLVHLAILNSDISAGQRSKFWHGQASEAPFISDLPEDVDGAHVAARQRLRPLEDAAHPPGVRGVDRVEGGPVHDAHAPGAALEQQPAGQALEGEHAGVARREGVAGAIPELAAALDLPGVALQAEPQLVGQAAQGGAAGGGRPEVVVRHQAHVVARPSHTADPSGEAGQVAATLGSDIGTREE